MNIYKNKYSYLFLGFVFIVTLSLCYVETVRWVSGGSDSAFFTEIVESVAGSGLPISRLQASTHDAVKYWSKSADEICDASLAPSGVIEENQFDKHTYYILYLISPLSYLIDAQILVPCLTIIGFMLVLFVAFKFLREKDVPASAAILFCLLVSAHPAWSISMSGQFYSDRFFIPLATLYLYILLGAKRNYLVMFVVGLISASVVERAGFMLGVFTVAYAALGAGLDKKDRRSIAITGFIYLAIAIGIMLFLIDNKRYGNQTAGVIDVISNLASGNIDEKLKVFLYFNLLLVCFALFRIKMFALAILMLLPNALGSIGGAEKTGWMTHYHSLYFPFLVMVSAWSFAELYQYLLGSARQWVAYFLVLLAILATVLAGPYSFLNYSLKNIEYNAFARAYNQLSDYILLGNQSQLAYLTTRKQRLRNFVPPGSAVTTTGGNMPTLYKGRSIYYYPVGIAQAEYAVLQMAENEEGGLYYRGAVSYHGEQEAKKMDLCLTSRMKKLGFDTYMPTIINDAVILSKTDGEYKFGEENLANPSFGKGIEGWNRFGDVKAVNGAGILVNINNHLSQKVEVEPAAVYRYALVARCEMGKTEFRLQVNWHDVDNKFITSDITLQSCTGDLKTYEIQVVAPVQSASAYFYVGGASGASVVVSSASFTKRLN
jgi:hypothetical protein